MHDMTTFALTASVPAVTNLRGEPLGSYTGTYRISAWTPDAADYVARSLLKRDLAEARLKALGAPMISDEELALA
jgi:hypothetical protein